MQRFLPAFAALLCAALLPGAVHAQNVSTTITHPRIYNGNQPVTGKVEVRVIDSHGVAQGIVSADGTTNGPGKPFPGIVTAGVISGLSVPDQCTSSALTPNTPLWYQVVATPATAPNSTVAWTLPPNTACGTTFALDSYRPTQTVPAIAAGMAAGTVVPARCTVPGTFQKTTTTPYTRYNCQNGVFVLDPSSSVSPNVPVPLSCTNNALTIPFVPGAFTYPVVAPGQNCTITIGAGTAGQASEMRVKVLASAYTVTFATTNVDWVSMPDSPTTTQYSAFHLTSFGSGNAAGND